MANCVEPVQGFNLSVWLRNQSVPDCRGLVADHDERYRGCYYGNYTFDGARLVTRVDAASDPARIGSDQIREVSFEGDTMILRPPPRQTEGGEEYREISWVRISIE